jgi:hypothetical protein
VLELVGGIVAGRLVDRDVAVLERVNVELGERFWLARPARIRART